METLRHQTLPRPLQGYAVLFSGVVLFHLIALDYFLSPWSFERHSIVRFSNAGLFLCLPLALLVLQKPSSLIRFLALLLGSFAYWFLQWWPRTPNHILFENLVGLSMTAGLCFALVARSKAAQRMLYTRIAPIVRAQVILLYTWAALHKVNSDFLNPATSCAVRLPSDITYFMGVHVGTSFPPYISWPMIIGTMLVELSIPILLTFSRTRLAGVVLGVGLHLMFCLHPIRPVASFSILMISLYFLFLPNSVLALIALKTRKALGHSSSAVFRLAVLSMSVLAAAGVMMWLARRFPVSPAAPYGHRTQWLYHISISLALYLPLCWLLWRFARLTREKQLRTLGVRVFRPDWLWFVAVSVTFAVGLAPYFGLRTLPTFSMFSNLRVETQPNHVLFRVYDTFGYYGDSVLVRKVKSVPFVNVGKWIPKVQLHAVLGYHQLVSTAPDVSVEYEENGVLHRVDSGSLGNLDAAGSPAPSSWLARKLVLFRPFDPERSECQW